MDHLRKEGYLGFGDPVVSYIVSVLFCLSFFQRSPIDPYYHHGESKGGELRAKSLKINPLFNMVCNLELSLVYIG